MNKKEHSKIAKSVLLSIPILFILGAPMHFLFDLLGKLGVVGAFVPVNESPWEHLKMVYYPILIWWIIYYFRFRKTAGFSKENWITSTAAAVIAAPIFIILFFYSYTGAFGTESLSIDILLQFLGIGVGQLLALHIYRYANQGRFTMWISFAAILILLFMFVFFTFNTPHIPLFLDRPTGGYGIV